MPQPKRKKIVPLRPRPEKRAGSAFVLHVALSEIAPPVWRRLRVAGDLTLRELHHVLQIAMGWTDSHLHEFRIGKLAYGMLDPEEDIGESPRDECDFPLYRVLKKGARAEYVYDFGDDWIHQLRVEEVEPLSPAEFKATCLAGARACPPEDCGGPYGYASLLEALADPAHERHDETREWVGPHFAPEEFDIRLVNRELRGAGTGAWRRKRERFYSS